MKQLACFLHNKERNMKSSNTFRIALMLTVLAVIFASLNLLPAQAADIDVLAGEKIDVKYFSVSTSTCHYVYSFSSGSTFSTLTCPGASASASSSTTTTREPKRNTTPVDVVPGEVASKGNCSVMLFNSAGTNPTLNNNSNLGNLSPSCLVSYGDGGPLAGWVYVSLNSYTGWQYENDKVTLHIKTANGWKTCTNPVFIPNETYGTLGCYASGVTSFGLGPTD